MPTVMLLNRWISILFVVCYTYQLFYLLVALLHKPVLPAVSWQYRYAVLIAARNEQAVIAQLIVYLSLYAAGLITTLSEWRRILGSPFKKIRATVTFPVFMLTYLPIALTSLFKNVVWQPTPYTCAVTLSQITSIEEKASGS